MGRGGMGMVLTFSEPGALSWLGLVLTFSEPGAIGIETLLTVSEGRDSCKPVGALRQPGCLKPHVIMFWYLWWSMLLLV